MSACAGGVKVRLERNKQPKQNDEGEDFYARAISSGGIFIANFAGPAGICSKLSKPTGQIDRAVWRGRTGGRLRSGVGAASLRGKQTTIWRWRSPGSRLSDS